MSLYCLYLEIFPIPLIEICFQVTHSSGNHGQALAYAALQFGIACTVVVPANAPESKLEAIRAYGATLVMCEATMPSRCAVAVFLKRLFK